MSSLPLSTTLSKTTTGQSHQLTTQSSSFPTTTFSSQTGTPTTLSTALRSSDLPDSTSVQETTTYITSSGSSRRIPVTSTTTSQLSNISSTRSPNPTLPSSLSRTGSVVTSFQSVTSDKSLTTHKSDPVPNSPDKPPPEPTEVSPSTDATTSEFQSVQSQIPPHVGRQETIFNADGSKTVFIGPPAKTESVYVFPSDSSLVSSCTMVTVKIKDQQFKLHHMRHYFSHYGSVRKIVRMKAMKDTVMVLFRTEQEALRAANGMKYTRVDDVIYVYDAH
ncbi:hypothetical protein BLNAU_7057 [Blattamonas nauphoetae]|uniref:RRM domain-containing protein n=1 Tax=Blattamonas nauphoetae TaxID=2049346 RepID=A0ABQ9Y2B3_9EUKA|nr:hypothetical protein BLNAU_7057 [Blattamonas nauphoetae]